MCMTDSLGDILREYDLDEPPEIRRLKAHVRKKYNTDVKVAVNGAQLVITVPSAALAGELRVQSYRICQECDIKQKLIIRIGR